MIQELILAIKWVAPGMVIYGMMIGAVHLFTAYLCKE